MKLHLLSDLHLEFQKGEPWRPEPVDADVVILAGDIALHTRGLDWATWAFNDWSSQPKVLYVAGNHEYYDAHLGLLAELQKPEWETRGVTFLEKRTVEFDGVRFLGCTLWSGFSLHGREHAEAYIGIAERGIADYELIEGRGGRPITGVDTLRLHQQAVAWLDKELRMPFDGKTVVITHFAPHLKCVAPAYEGSDLSPYFVTDLSELMACRQIDVWCYGHTHTNISFVAEGGCRLVSNQRGYPRERLAGGVPFDPELIIEI